MGRSKIKGPDYQPQSGCGLQPRVDAAAEFDLDDPRIHSQVRDDYEAIRGQIRNRGIDSVTGDLGKLVQARTKGRGHGSTTRAFYARPVFVAHILNLQKLAFMPRVFADEEKALS